MASGEKQMRGRRDGVILFVVLVIVAMVALLALSFFYQMNAEYQATKVRSYEVQARAAAMSGIERVGLLLREHRLDPTKWYSSPKTFHRQLIYDRLAPEAHLQAEEVDAEIGDDAKRRTEAWRYSIVRTNFSNDRKPAYGIIDESAKLNINVAPAAMLLRLEGMNQALVDALIDWRDDNNNPEPQGAENEYYQQLDPPYNCKNAIFDTVEELLLVRGFTAALLWGEDANRNGMLDPNEDDGDNSQPPDNNDGKLDRGIAPFITVYSRDFNTANDNKPRININGSGGIVAAMMKEFFTPEVIEFVTFARQKLSTGGQPAFQSPADLLDMEVEGRKSPVKLEDMPLVMDRLTTSQLPGQFGLINVNTAPREVLATIPGLASRDIDAILEKRGKLDGEKLRTVAWLVTEQVVGVTTFKAVSKYLTARSMQFSVEVVGFRDGLGIQSRVQTVLEMRGPQPQVLYFRDLTSLGPAYNLADPATEDLEIGGESSG